jgi:hydroxyacylglutathione hydrolase
MYIEQIYTNCLAQASYYIESNGEAAVIDPIRDYQSYLSLAAERKAKLKYVFETHFHADFVSGHIDLAKAAGIPIVYGPETETAFDVHVAKDGEEFNIGEIKIKALHTPGHTPESTSYLLRDENGKDHAVFTGDTLFIGDVGRPDLFDGKFTREEMCTRLYNSLNTKIKTLADDVIVYPAHGAGSSCGKSMGPERQSTIGIQKAVNYAMQDMSVEEFIRQVTDGISAPPMYFAKNASINKTGYEQFDAVLHRGMKALSVKDMEAEVKKGAIIIDSRRPDDFEQGFIPKAMNIGLDGQYAIWAATLIDLKTPIVLVCEKGKEQESVLRLTRTGFENIVGFLGDGFAAWQEAGKAIDMVISIEPDELLMDARFDKNIQIIDVRKPGEWESGHLPQAQHFSLQDLEENVDRFDKEKPYYIHCGGGYRSMIAASIFKQHGYTNVRNVYGGYTKIMEVEKEMKSA